MRDITKTFRKPQRKDRGFLMATQICSAMPNDLLGLRTRLLVADIRAKFSCATSTAMLAVSMARVRAGLVHREAAE